ncbi:TetR/AcrR family transcriptional regulator [Lutimonas saemankumensis]|uniref:TetR/AcrR family transcriptional regulator n=1 Tax=Lutimonas saemankumensis TaxID=483016 RepID=UPI001CD6ECAD|nr:TetR/AcrR family transcriptional regulator [Lutimonas saemankumensis]MCA0933732.1 TetR/AcrR family transcriptional regulator [Lutimonas saemankumensis]
MRFKNSELPWLRDGLRLLAEGGNNNMNIDILSKRVGKAKTSFYHHFGSKKEFLYRLAQYWEKFYTVDYIEELRRIENPRKRLKELLRKAYSGMDRDFASIQFKELALTDDKLSKLVDEVEKLRLKFIKDNLRALGMDEETAILKSKGYMYLFFGWSVLHPVYSGKDRSNIDELETLIELFIFSK